MNELGCSDGFCYIKGKAKGMHTNGGCRCVQNLVGRNNTAARVALEKKLADLHKTIEFLRTQLPQPNTEQDIAHKIARRLPIWMLDTYDKDSLSSMLSAVSYLKQQVSNQSE